MEVITIDSKAYQALIDKIERIAEYVVRKEDSCGNSDREIWLDSHELANLLKISTKTLQRLRNIVVIFTFQISKRNNYNTPHI